MRRLFALLLGLLLMSVGLAGAWAQEVGPEEVVTVEIPLLNVEDEQPLPVIAQGTINLPEACDYCYMHTVQYRVIVPEETVRLVIELSNISDPWGDIDLVVRVGEPATEDAESYYFTYRTYEDGGQERLELPDEADVALSFGEYYIGIISLTETEADFELRAAAYVEELLPEEVVLTPNVPVEGTVPAHSCSGGLDEQFSILIPEEAELFALQVMGEKGNVDLYVGHHPITTTPGGRIKADYHLHSRGWGESIIIESPQEGRYWLIVENPTNAQQPFSLIATPLPDILDVTSEGPVSGIAGSREGLIPFLIDYLKTNRGLVNLTQYRIEVPRGAVEVRIRLHALDEGNLELHIRQDSPVSVVDQAVVADLASSSPGDEEIILHGAFLNDEGVYYVAIEALGEEEHPFELTVDFVFAEG